MNVPKTDLNAQNLMEYIHTYVYMNSFSYSVSMVCTHYRKCPHFAHHVQEHNTIPTVAKEAHPKETTPAASSGVQMPFGHPEVYITNVLYVSIVRFWCALIWMHLCILLVNMC